MFRNFFILWTVSAAIFHVLLGCCSPYVGCCAYACTMCVNSSSPDCEGGCPASHRGEEEDGEPKHGSSLSSSPCGHNHPSPSAPCDEIDCQFVFAPRTDDTLDRLSIDLLAAVQDVLPASFVPDVLPRIMRIERPGRLFLATNEPLHALKQVWLV